MTVYPIAIESPSFRPAPLKRLAARDRRPLPAAQPAPQRSQAIYAALAQELRRTWQLSYVTTARPGETLELAAGRRTRRRRVAPGIAAAVGRRSSTVPEPLFAVGPALVASLVGVCVLLGAVFLLQRTGRHRAAAAASRRISASGERKRARGPGAGALRDCLVADARDRAGVRPPAGSGTSCTSCSSGPTCRSGRSSSSTSALGTGLLVGTRLRRSSAAGSSSSLARDWSPASTIPVVVVWYKAKRRAERASRTSSPTS